MTGLMSLVYMAELSTVFNLAYAELTKGRYTGAIDRLAKLPSRIVGREGAKKFPRSLGPLSPTSDGQVALNSLIEKYERLESPAFWQRYSEWNAYPLDEELRFTGTCGSLGLMLYRNEFDRYFAFFMTFVSSAIVIVATANQYWELVNWLLPERWEQLDHPRVAQAFFGILLFAMAIPPIFVIFGRQVRAVTEAVVKSFSAEWTAVASKSIEDLLPPLTPDPH